MKVVSWHPVLTDHQSYTLDELQVISKCDLKIYVMNREHVERQAQGWVNQHALLLEPELIPKRKWLKFTFRRLCEDRDTVHIFNSPFEQFKLIVVLLMAVALGRKIYLISEPYSPISIGYQNDNQKYINLIKAKIRPLLYRFYGVLLRYRINGVFAISCRAIAQYRLSGIASKKIHPFGYFVPFQMGTSNIIGSHIAAHFKKKIKIVFVGNLIERKGLDILVQAVNQLNNNDLVFRLDIYGPGDPGQFIKDLTLAKVSYCGLISFGNAQAVISKYDILVLPSRYDGWGVVVNEALMVGVPVICSDRVGASAIIDKWKCGIIFENENVSDLVEKLKELLINPASLKDMRMAALKVGKRLEPNVAGKYMLDIINQDSKPDSEKMKVDCPWYECK